MPHPEHKSLLLTMRIIAVVVPSLALLLWYIRYGSGLPVDPLWMRLAVMAVWLGYLAATFFAPAVRANPRRWMVYPVLSILPLLILGVVQHEYAWRTLPGVLMVMFCGSLLINETRALLVFLGLLLCGVGGGLALVDQPEALPVYYAVVTLLTAAVIFLSQEMRYRGAESLRESEARTRRAQQLAHIGGWEYRLPDGPFVLSPELRRMLGWDELEAASPQQARAHLQPGDWDKLQRVLRAAARDPRPFTIEVRARARAGHTLHLRMNGEPLYDSSGRASAVIGASQDVSQDVLLAAHLRAARDAAQQAATARARFLANMSHEIRTPMNGVIGMTNLLRDTPLSAEQRDCVDTIRISGESLLTIINDVLDFSKIDAGKIELEHHVFALEAAVAESMSLLAPRAAEKGLELVYLIDPVVPHAVIGDDTRLRQVLVNLVSNAVKFTHAGDVYLHVGGRWLASDQFELECVVRDTGIGIAPQRIERLFDAFTQEDSSTTRRFGGTGLGLAISRHLVELMGGAIHAANRAEGGAEFRFSARVEVAGVTPAEIDALAGLRVLAVDDNATNRHVLHTTLQRFGAQVQVVSTPAEFLAAAVPGRFDRYVVDLQMPELDGAGVTARLRQQCGASCAPVIALSSLGADVPRRHLFDAIISKPVRSDVLRNTLASPPRPPARRRTDSDSDSDSYMDTDMGMDTDTDTDASAAPAAALSHLAHQDTPRVLLAEDHAVNQKVATRLLQRVGLTPDLASNGLQAVQAVRNRHYDLVFMDVQMPEMDGLQATANIRAVTPDVWIIAMTANAMPGDRELCLAAGMDDYLAKPVTVDSIRRALERWRVGDASDRSGRAGHSGHGRTSSAPRGAPGAVTSPPRSAA